WGQRAFNLFGLSFHKHTGIHVDTPFDVSADALSVDRVTVGNLVVPLCEVDVLERAQDESDSLVTPYVLKVWTDAYGPVWPPAREVQR
ncbi:MAG: cyclase family protein, partial [Pseudomonadota bacterium]